MNKTERLKEESKLLFETVRLAAIEFTIDDALFIMELVNSAEWLEYIGDRGVRNIEDARNYLLSGPIKSYRENGFGLWKVVDKSSQRPIGMCGLLKRDYLEHVDIGFALLPGYFGKGFGTEIASAALRYSQESLGIEDVMAITDPRNAASINLLGKTGFSFVKEFALPDHRRSLLFLHGR